MGVETESATGQDVVRAAGETTELAASEIDDPRDTGEADPSDTDVTRESADTASDDTETEDAEDAESPAPRRRIKWARVLAFVILPAMVVLFAAAAGFLKWQDSWARGSGPAGIESVAAAKESTVAMLSYQPDSVEKDLGAASGLLTGNFKDSYTELVHDVVIPGAKKQHISAIATVPAASSVSATPRHAVALLFVNQTVVVGNDAPSDTASTVRVTMDKAGDRWLISAFDPI